MSLNKWTIVTALTLFITVTLTPTSIATTTSIATPTTTSSATIQTIQWTTTILLIIPTPTIPSWTQIYSKTTSTSTTITDQFRRKSTWMLWMSQLVTSSESQIESTSWWTSSNSKEIIVEVMAQGNPINVPWVLLEIECWIAT